MLHSTLLLVKRNKKTQILNYFSYFANKKSAQLYWTPFKTYMEHRGLEPSYAESAVRAVFTRVYMCLYNPLNTGLTTVHQKLDINTFQ